MSNWTLTRPLFLYGFFDKSKQTVPTLPLCIRRHPRLEVARSNRLLISFAFLNLLCLGIVMSCCFYVNPLFINVAPRLMRRLFLSSFSVCLNNFEPSRRHLSTSPVWTNFRFYWFLIISTSPSGAFSSIIFAFNFNLICDLILDIWASSMTGRLLFECLRVLWFFFFLNLTASARSWGHRKCSMTQRNFHSILPKKWWEQT